MNYLLLYETKQKNLENTSKKSNFLKTAHIPEKNFVLLKNKQN